MTPAAVFRATAALAVLGSLLFSSAAMAQREGGPRGRDNRDVAGVFDYYVLSLSWSPTHCEEVDPRARDPQCSGRQPRPFSFVLHGLWPQYERGWPQDCRTRQPPFVPETVIGRMLDVMPSRQLVIHEYRKHGTCSGLEPAAYFDLARRYYETIRVPDRFVRPAAPFMIGRDEVVDAFIAANPKFDRSMIHVACGGSGPRLQEVRVCLTREGAPRRCGADVDPRKTCRSDRVFVPPVRG